MLPPGRPGGLGGGAHSVDSGLSGDHGRKSEVVSVFFGSSHDHLSIPFCSSSIMVQPKLKEKDWKRNHHFVKVRSLDVFGTFQFQYIWFVYICGFIYWPFFGPPHPPSTWRLVACCPGKPLKLRHPCNRTWEPWHFTSKKKGWTFWYFGHCQQYVRAKGCIKSSGNDRSLFLRGSRNPEVYVRNCLNPRPMTLSSPETLRSTAFSPGDSVPGQFFHVGKCWSFEHQTRILTWHAKQMWFTEEMGACQLSMQHCNNNAWWPCAQRSGQRKHSVAWKSCSKVRLGRCMVEREYAFHIGEMTQISKNYHPKICTWTCTARKCLMLFVLPLQRCIFHWFALMSWENQSISTGSQPGSCCWWSTCQEAAGSEVAGIATQMDTDGKSTDVESILLLII